MRVVEIRYRWKPGVATQFMKLQGKLREQLPQLVVTNDELCGKPRFSLFISPRRPFRNIYESGAVYAMVPVRETALGPSSGGVLRGQGEEQPCMLN